MQTWTQDNATCEVLTFKAGLLSAVGHDLLLRVTRFQLTYDDGTLKGSFDGTSFEFGGVVKNGTVIPDGLSPKDQAEVLKNIKKHVFKKHREESITFECPEVDEEEDSLSGEGTLTIPPSSHSIRFEATLADGMARCEVTLHQPDWRIKPFSALMGTLKVKPDVVVRLQVPWSA